MSKAKGRPFELSVPNMAALMELSGEELIQQSDIIRPELLEKAADALAHDRPCFLLFRRALKNYSAMIDTTYSYACVDTGEGKNEWVIGMFTHFAERLGVYATILREMYLATQYLPSCQRYEAMASIPYKFDPLRGEEE